MTISHHLRQAQLLDAICTEQGEWTTRRVQDFYRALNNPAPLRTTARKDLRALHVTGHLVQNDDNGRRFYTLNTRKDVRP
ncbi:hypothetical protein [Streptomyces sp. NPDC008240]|uniref:hypothetical protein n=1 Tax=Streptomyces sp. NPDC008240 TaxID=3364822 RepID=UPI0036E967D0